jgi:hypothetical protein
MKLLIMALAMMGTAAFADDTADTKISTEQKTEAPSAPKLKATLTSYYYEFEGTKADKHDLYSFSNSNLNMQLATVQYEFTPKLTMMVMASRLDNYVETNLFGNRYKDRTEGAGDTLVSAVSSYAPSASFLVVGDLGVSVPTGSINEKNKADPTGESTLAYNMQLGSGTYDTVVGVTPMYFTPDYQLGGRLSATLRNGYNSEGYRLGNLYKGEFWADYPTSLGLTPRLTGYYKHKDSIVGEDKRLGRYKGGVFKDLTEFYYHNQVNWEVSAALKYSKELTKAVAVTAEVGKPLLQDMSNYDDVVVGTEYYGNIGVTGQF